MNAGWLLLLLALGNGVAFALSGLGTRFEWWDYRIGLQILRVSSIAALALGALAIVALLIPRLRAGGTVNAIAALIVSFGVVALPLKWMQQARSLPVINDITTDTANPPAFVAVLPRRADAPVPAAYPGASVAQAQREAYPDIAPLVLRVPPAVAFAKAEDTARTAGWEIVATDKAAGRIEATATTTWFGFKDDVVVRIAPAPGGSRIDVRSVSRVGKSDLGTNAQRIRTYLARLAALP
jgi:uncharacterized protein (DUF1499 family)